ncbi:hypothetical protein [uncultured Aquimarina sp.]|uniref:hypothetical protein n=1 Tax=uncultured Aquimarina sp. TaxID=575652 RepID=UPI00262F4F4B|nr:hypothetical protein [uncultured Aquimarina sp.]
MGTNTFKLQVAGITKTASIEVVEDITFTVHFERKKDYDGEFGFDWMRENYSEISNNYEELKKEYKDAQINGSEYFVPYLSMLPNQDDVVFNLKLEVLEGKARKDDIIKFPAKDGIKFEPNEISLKDLQKEQEAVDGEKAKGYDGDVSSISRTEVKVICENTLSQDTSIELLDKNDNVVGEIIVIKNDEVLDLSVHFVRVKGNEPNNTYNDRTFNGFNENKIIELLSKKSLNQALINVTLDNVSEIILDVEDLKEKGVLMDSGGNIPRFYEEKHDFRKTIDELFKQQNPNFRGAVYYLSAIPPDGRQGGHAAVYPKESDSIVVAPDQIGINAKSTFVHELGHLLGLLHSFEEGTKAKYDRLIASRKAKIEEYRTKENVKIRYEGQVITSSEYIDILQRQIDQLNSIVENNEFKFKQSGTDNFMDYYNSNPVAFNKWQWDIMREEIKQYHG